MQLAPNHLKGVNVDPAVSNNDTLVDSVLSVYLSKTYDEEEW